MLISQKRIKQLIDVTIVILKSHDFQSINTLKKFLKVIPNPNQIRVIITVAVEEIFDTNSETIFWLLQHPECLQPEVNIKEIIAQKLSEKLCTMGFDDEYFHFNNDGELKINRTIKDELLSDPKLFKLIGFFENDREL